MHRSQRAVAPALRRDHGRQAALLQPVPDRGAEPDGRRPAAIHRGITEPVLRRRLRQRPRGSDRRRRLSRSRRCRANPAHRLRLVRIFALPDLHRRRRRPPPPTRSPFSLSSSSTAALKSKALALAHEVDRPAMRAAPEAVIEALAVVDGEARRALVVERAQAGELLAGLLQLDHPADHPRHQQAAADPRSRAGSRSRGRRRRTGHRSSRRHPPALAEPLHLRALRRAASATSWSRVIVRPSTDQATPGAQPVTTARS